MAELVLAPDSILVFKFLLFSFASFWTLSLTEACLCHLIPNYTCPPPPHCCESGQYTFDECGCCLTCAKSELQPCGGASSSSGKCAQGLACLKTCTPCKTIGSKPEPCIFPFEYQGHVFDQCTIVDAVESGTAWCATEIYENKTVVDGRWGDCDEGCPGARHACDERRFSILIGKCINPNVPGAIPNWLGAPPYRLLEKTTDLFPAPLCAGDNSKRRRQYVNTCRCASGQDAIELDDDGSVRGNCTGVDNDDGDGVNPVWCFLENIRDPSNPSSGCYPDTNWSPKDGRFWSAQACNGLPPLDSDDQALPDSTRFPLGEKNPLFQAALKTPFKRPEDVFDVEDRSSSTQAPKKLTTISTRKKPSTSTTVATPVRSTTTTSETTKTTTTRTTTTTTAPTTTVNEDSEDVVDTVDEETSSLESLIDDYKAFFDDDENDFTISNLETSSNPVSSSNALPVASPAAIPVASPADIPVESPADIPVASPADIPVASPADVPVASPSDVPVASPSASETTEASETINTPTTLETTVAAVKGSNEAIEVQSIEREQAEEKNYDESEYEEGTTDFRDEDDLFYFDTSNVAKEDPQETVRSQPGLLDIVMNLPIANQREDGIEFLPTPRPSSKRRRIQVNLDNLQDLDSSDPPPLTTRRTTETSSSEEDILNFGDKEPSSGQITTDDPSESLEEIELSTDPDISLVSDVSNSVANGLSLTTVKTETHQITVQTVKTDNSESTTGKTETDNTRNDNVETATDKIVTDDSESTTLKTDTDNSTVTVSKITSSITSEEANPVTTQSSKSNEDTEIPQKLEDSTVDPTGRSQTVEEITQKTDGTVTPPLTSALFTPKSDGITVGQLAEDTTTVPQPVTEELAKTEASTVEQTVGKTEASTVEQIEVKTEAATVEQIEVKTEAATVEQIEVKTEATTIEPTVAKTEATTVETTVAKAEAKTSEQTETKTEVAPANQTETTTLGQIAEETTAEQTAVKTEETTISTIQTTAEIKIEEGTVVSIQSTKTAEITVQTEGSPVKTSATELTPSTEISTLVPGITEIPIPSESDPLQGTIDTSSDNTTNKSDVTQALRSPKSQDIQTIPKVDLGIFGSFWLEKPVQVGEVSETERPSPVFRIEDYTDKFPG